MHRLSQSPTDPAFVQDPYPFYAKARAAGPLIFWEDYGAVAATTHEAVNVILKDRRFGRTPPPFDIPDHLTDFYALEAHSLLELDPPRHTRLRALVLRAFTSGAVEALRPQIAETAHSLIDAFPDGPFDLLPAFATPLPLLTITRLLGLPEGVAPQLLAWSNAMVRMYQPARTHADEEASNTAARDFAAFLRTEIAARRTTPTDDLLSRLIAAHDEGDRLSAPELVSTVILLLNAGHEATVHTLGNAVKTLLEAGETARRPVPVEELLRFDPPLHVFARYALEEVTLYGHTFAPGDRADCLLASAARDGAPEHFAPEAKAPRHTAFGGGLHFCVGAPLARLEIEVALTILLDRCPTLALTEHPRYADIYHFHGLEGLVVSR
ncbi:cytochrome P450 [Aestuariibius sp. 2305UL40-4]|uniref:cytochrome P450 n=1 Tax=Aestuariibius violaceus TaxID=3234132 RepID=UPI00345E2DD0